MNKIKSSLLRLFKLFCFIVFVVVTLTYWHESTIVGFAESAKKYESEEFLFGLAEKIPFASVTRHDRTYWEERKEWIDAYIEIDSSFTESIGCVLMIREEQYTGTWTCQYTGFFDLDSWVEI